MIIANNRCNVMADLNTAFSFCALFSPMAKEIKRCVPLANVAFKNVNMVITDEATDINPMSDTPNAFKMTRLV